MKALLAASFLFLWTQAGLITLGFSEEDTPLYEIGGDEKEVLRDLWELQERLKSKTSSSCELPLCTMELVCSTTKLSRKLIDRDLCSEKHSPEKDSNSPALVIEPTPTSQERLADLLKDSEQMRKFTQVHTLFQERELLRLEKQTVEEWKIELTESSREVAQKQIESDIRLIEKEAGIQLGDEIRNAMIEVLLKQRGISEKTAPLPPTAPPCIHQQLEDTFRRSRDQLLSWVELQSIPEAEKTEIRKRVHLQNWAFGGENSEVVRWKAPNTVELGSHLTPKELQAAIIRELLHSLEPCLGGSQSLFQSTAENLETLQVLETPIDLIQSLNTVITRLKKGGPATKGDLTRYEKALQELKSDTSPKWCSHQQVLKRHQFTRLNGTSENQRRISTLLSHRILQKIDPPQPQSFRSTEGIHLDLSLDCEIWSKNREDQRAFYSDGSIGGGPLQKLDASELSRFRDQRRRSQERWILRGLLNTVPAQELPCKQVP